MAKDSFSALQVNMTRLEEGLARTLNKFSDYDLHLFSVSDINETVKTVC